MMSAQNALNTSVTADSKKGRQAVAIFRAAYDKALLEEDGAQLLNEHPDFAEYLAVGIRRFSAKPAFFPTFLDIEVGGKSKDELFVELEANGMFASDWVKDIMSKPAWKSGKRERVKFARAKVRDLGFTKNPTTTQVWARIQELGHSLCEPCDGPAIRLALTDQTRGDYFWCAMEQITDSGGSPDVFHVGRSDDGEPWLRAGWVRPGGGWDLGGGVAFRLRK